MAVPNLKESSVQLHILSPKLIYKSQLILHFLFPSTKHERLGEGHAEILLLIVVQKFMHYIWLLLRANNGTETGLRCG